MVFYWSDFALVLCPSCCCLSDLGALSTCPVALQLVELGKRGFIRADSFITQPNMAIIL